MVNQTLSLPSLPSELRDPESAFVAALEAEARAHRAVNHPYLRALENGVFPDPRGAILDLTHQYMAYSANFPRYLTATISHLEEPGHRKLLLSNLAEESGVVGDDETRELAAMGIALEWVAGVPHPLLYRRFLTSAGMDDAWLAAHPFCDEATVWGMMFLQCCRQGAAQSVGALGLGTELIVRHVYAPVLRAIERYVPVSRQERVFFDLHVGIDDAHGASLASIAVDLAKEPTERIKLRYGMLMALQLRAAFYDQMTLRAQAMTPTASLSSVPATTERA